MKLLKLLKLLGVGVGGSLALLVVVGAVLPSGWKVKRSVQIQAPPPLVHAHIANLRRWPDWSWLSARTDLAATLEWAGADGQLGSTLAWSGPKLGRGRIALVKSIPPDSMELDEAIESDGVNAHGWFKLAAKDGGTEVEWRDEGETPPIVGGYLRSLLESTLARQMELSLSNLKRTCEADAAAHAAVPRTDLAAGVAP